MTRRQKALRFALDLNRFINSIKNDKSSLGMVLYTFHSPGRIDRFNNIKEIKELRSKVIRSAKEYLRF
jgi:hypothetical protein